MKYMGYGQCELTPDEECQIQEFLDEPEEWLWRHKFLDINTRYNDWCEWFEGLKFQKPKDRFSWHEYLIKRYYEMVENYIAEPAYVPITDHMMGYN